MPASSFIITWPTLAREQFAVRAEPHARRAINDLINSLFDYLDPLMVAAHVRKVPLPITAYEQAKNSTTPDLYDVLEEMLLVTVAEEDKYDHLFAIMRGYFQFMRTVATYKPDGITDHVRDHAPEFWRVMWANSKWLFFDLFKGLENEGTSDPWYIRTGLSVVLRNFVTLDQAGPKEKSSRTKDGCFELLASFWLFGPFGTDFSKQGADFALDHYESLEWASTYKPGSDVPKKAVSWIAGLGTERILDKLWDNLNDTRLSYHTLSQTAVLLSWVPHAAPGNEVLDLFSRKSVSRSLMLAVERVLNLGEFGDGFLPSYRQLLGSARRTINGVMNAATKFNRPLTTDILRPVDVIQALVAQVDACLFYGSVICTYPATIFLDDIQKYRTMTTPLGINEMKIALRAKWYPALVRIRTHENKAASLCTQSHGVKKADHTLAGLLREWQKLGRDFDLYEEEERLRHERHDARVHCSWYQCPWHHLEAPHSLFACTGCRDVYYCGKNCQKSDWHEGGHRERCRRLTGSSKKKLALKGDA